MSTTLAQLISSSRYPKKVILEKLIRARLDLTKTQLFTETDRTIDSGDLAWIDAGYTAYTVDKQPLEYIIGSVEFLGIAFKVTPATLIPRPETEYMITAIRDHLAHQQQTYTLLDIGTGCGVLGLSTLIHNPSAITTAILTDLSTEALAVARQNYTRLINDHPPLQKIEPLFLQSNLLDHPQITKILDTQVVLLVANLPYIPDQLFDDNTDITVHKREPRMAFVGGDDGLDLYRDMLDQLLGRDLSAQTVLFLEMMTWQVDILRKAYQDHFNFEEVATFHFNIRIVRATPY